MQFGSMPNLKYLSTKTNSAGEKERIATNEEQQNTTEAAMLVRRDSEPSLSEDFGRKKVSSADVQIQLESSALEDNEENTEAIENGFIDEEEGQEEKLKETEVDWRLTPTPSVPFRNNFDFDSTEFHNKSEGNEETTAVAKLSSDIDQNLIKCVLIS